jgi:hypothetical protein
MEERDKKHNRNMWLRSVIRSVTEMCDEGT